MKKLSVISALILVAIIGFAAILPMKSLVDKGYKVGDKVSDFSLKNIDNTQVSLASIKETKGFIVIFTCNHCPFAKMYEDRVIDLHKQFATQGYPVVAISSNDVVKQPEDSFELMAARAKEKSYPFVYLYDETQEVALRFGAMRTPHVYVLTKKGTELEVAYIGAIDDKPENEGAVNEKFVKNAVNQLLKGQKVIVANTKAVGCTIKWK